MKYQINQHLLHAGLSEVGERDHFRPGDIVSEQELADAGFKDIDRLLNPGERGRVGFPAALTPIFATEGMVDASPRTLAAAQKDADEAARKAADEAAQSRATEEAKANLGGGVVSEGGNTDGQVK